LPLRLALQAVENRVRLSKRVLGVSLAANVLWDREQLHQSMLVGKAIPSSVQYQDTLHQVTNYFVAQGSSLIQAHQQAIQWIGEQVQTHAGILPRLYGCVLAADGYLARRRAAR